MDKKSLLRSALLLSLFFAAIVVYWPGLQGPFLFDDYPNIEPMGYFGGVNDADSAKKFIFGNASGPTGRPVAMASFILDDNAWPSNPWKFKLTNLLLHLLAGLLLFLVARKFLRISNCGNENNVFWLSLIITAVWLLHPLNVSTVLYVIQRMAILSTIFVLAGLFFYLRARESYYSNRIAALVSYFFFLVFLLIGVFAKENALVLILFVIVLECFWFRKPVAGLNAKASWSLVIGGCVLSVLVLYVSYDIWGSGYANRDYTVWERLFYQVSAVGDYALKTLVPLLSEMNMFRGYYESAEKIEYSFHYLVRSLILLTLVVFLIVGFVKKNKLQTFGLLWFFTFHSIESTILPLELYFEHRNYLPGIGLIIFSVGLIYSAIKLASPTKLICTAIPVSILVFFIFNTFILSLTWAKTGSLLMKWEMDEPLSARAKVMYGDYLYRQGFPENTIEHIDRAIELRPNSLGLYLKKINVICEAGLNADYDMLVESLKSAEKFDLGATAEIRSLIKHTQGEENIKCSGVEFPLEVSDVFLISERAGVGSGNAKRAAQYYSLKSDFYAKRGDLDSSVNAIEKASTYQPSVDLYLKASVMLASAGLYDEALEKLEKAKGANRTRRAFYPDRMNELANLEKRIKSLVVDSKDDRGPKNEL